MRRADNAGTALSYEESVLLPWRLSLHGVVPLQLDRSADRETNIGCEHAFVSTKCILWETKEEGAELFRLPPLLNIGNLRAPHAGTLAEPAQRRAFDPAWCLRREFAAQGKPLFERFDILVQTKYRVAPCR